MKRPVDPLISVVVPVLDEADCIDELVRRAGVALDGVRFELIFVDDGSRDATPERIAAARAGDSRVKSIRFTRCFGHQAALVAGLHHARGDAVVTMDGDLQHPPEFLPRMIEAWQNGADVVHTARRSEGPPGWKERSARAFYRLMSALTDVPMVTASADFRLMDRRAVEAFAALDEHFVFLRGLVPWFGFRSVRLDYPVEPRFAGESKYSLVRMVRLALDGIFSFSVLPLRLITLLGLFTTLFGVAFGVFSLVSWLLGAVESSGWTSVVVLILVFGGAQLLSLGIVAEYVGRTYEEAKRRPRYVIEATEGLDTP